MIEQTTLALGRDTLQEAPAVYDAVAAIIIQQGRLLDFIDGRTQREETPEEYVRQEIAKSLVREYDYPKRDIGVEFTVRTGSRKPRAGPVVLLRGQRARPGAGQRHRGVQGAVGQSVGPEGGRWAAPKLHKGREGREVRLRGDPGPATLRADGGRSGAPARGPAIVGNSLRGDWGEYFTPRNTCAVAVAMLDPTERRVMMGPACGTGGSLITAMNHDGSGGLYEGNPLASPFSFADMLPVGRRPCPTPDFYITAIPEHCHQRCCRSLPC